MCLAMILIALTSNIIWPRHCSHLSRQVICPGRSFVPFVCAMSSQTIDLLSRGDTQKGWDKVTTTSVMDVLKWRTGDYRVLVRDAEPMIVPGLMFFM